MRAGIILFLLISLLAGCNSGSDAQLNESDVEFVNHLFLSEEFYEGYKDSNKDQADRLLNEFLLLNEEFLKSGTGDNERYYLSNIVLTNARIGLLRAADKGDSMELEMYLKNALPAYRNIQGEAAEGKTPQDLKEEIIIWVLALDLDKVSWLSPETVASLGLTKELREVQVLLQQSHQLEPSH